MKRVRAMFRPFSQMNPANTHRVLNHLTSLAKCLSIRLPTNWLCVPVQLQSRSKEQGASWYSGNYIV